jgi:DNA/RNA endonuclease YhcR with UshA esterase domain
MGTISVYADEEVELTKDMFYNWNGYGADAVSTSAANVDFNVGNDAELGGGNMVCGTASVDYLIYADLTGSTKMLFEGTPGLPLRVLMNRQESNSGPLVEKNPVIGNDGKAELDLTDLTYVHLNAIKVAWGETRGKVNSIKLVKPSDPLAASKELLKKAINNGKAQNSFAKTEESFAVLTKAIADAEAALVAADATAESLAGATKAINDAVAALALKDGFAYLKAEMFKHYASLDAPGEGEAVNCSYEVNKASDLPFGDGNVSELNWADLSSYDNLYVVTSGDIKPRFCLNRLVAGGQQAATKEDSKMLDINPNNEYTWSTEAYQTVENNVYGIDVKKIVEDYKFARLHCIKKQGWGAGVFVTDLLLYNVPAPATTDVTFDFNASTHPTSASGDTKGDIIADETIAIDDVVMTITPAASGTANRYWSTSNGPQLRMYSGKMTIVAPENKAITKVVINQGKWNAANTFNGVAAEKSEWTGNSTNFVFEVAGNTQINSVVVTIADKTAETTTYAPKTIANTAETAYTVAEAIRLIDAGEALSDIVFVKGIVSQVDSLKEGAMYYWISDDGTTTNQFECYKGKNIDGADFAAIDDVVVGAEVIVTGVLTKYKETYELKGGNALVSYAAPAPAEDSELMKQAKELAADADAVAVGKLLAAIAAAEESGDESNLQAAIDQFKADNANLEKDMTAKVGTAQADWTGATGSYNKNVPTAAGTEVKLVESFGNTAVGFKLSQEVSVDNGLYNVELYATSHNAWEGQWMDPTEDSPAPALQQDANDVAYVFASSGENFVQEWITARRNSGMLETEPEVFALKNVEVADGKLIFGLALAQKGQTEWHTIQIKSLTWFTTAKAAYAADQAELKAALAEAKALLADETKTEGRDGFEFVIIGAEQAVDSKLINITELEAVIGNLKSSIDYFKKANYFIDFAEGSYYVIDAESGKMMAAGHDYGTRGIVNEIGLDLTVAINREKRMVTFDSQVKNNDTDHFLGSNLYMDASAAEWALEYQGFGFFITNGTQYINIDANDNLVMSDTPREWIIVTAEGVMEQRLGEMAEATAEKPVDATFLIQGANFNRNDQRNNAWTVSADCTNKNMSGGNQVNNCAESYHSTFTISQVLKNAPKGVYKLTAQGFYRQDEGLEEAAPVFFIGDQSADIPVKTGEENNMSNASESFSKGLYTIEAIEYVADADTMVIGVKNETAKNQWIIWDNFQLTYYGPATEPQPIAAHTWDFTKWSEATVANLKAEAAKVTVEADPDKEGNTMCTDNDALWSDHEKKPGTTCETYAASKDNCFWYIGGEAEPKANGEAIAEFAGLEFNTTYGASRALAIAVNYPSTSLGTYNGPAYLWFGGKNQTVLTIKNVKAGTQIKMGVETHKIGDARGVQLLIGETVLKDAEGAEVAAPKEYTEQTWQVPAGEGVVDVVVKNTNGCHIYFIDAEIGEAPVPQPEIEKFYIMGTGTANAWDNTTEMPYNEETKAFEYTVEGADGVWIAFGDAAFTDWDDFNANHRYAIGEGDKNATLGEALQLQKVNGTLALAAGKYNVSVTKALLCTITKVDTPTPQPVIADGVYDLTSDMFMKWESHEATEGQALGCNVVLFEPTGLPYGDGNVFWLNYANLTPYDKLVVTVEQGAPRFCFNRIEDNAQDNDDPETAKFIDIPGHSWGTQAYETVDENGYRFIIDLKKMTAERGFAHLHAIKGANWADVKCSAIKLVKGDVELPTSGISTVKFNMNLNGTIYNLNGQKMEKAQKGLYIINGKKVVVK